MSRAHGPIDRIAGRYTIDDSGCWLWTGGRDRHGYGTISSGGRKTRAHRVSYETYVGPIPEGLQLDHTCRVRICVNPDHLDAVTSRENTLRGFEARDRVGSRLGGSCKQNHPFDEANTAFLPSGRRQCRACNRTRQQRYQDRLKASA